MEVQAKVPPKCTCGRSLSRDGTCWGWHTLTEEQYQAIISQPGEVTEQPVDPVE